MRKADESKIATSGLHLTCQCPVSPTSNFCIIASKFGMNCHLPAMLCSKKASCDTRSLQDWRVEVAKLFLNPYTESKGVVDEDSRDAEHTPTCGTRHGRMTMNPMMEPTITRRDFVAGANAVLLALSSGALMTLSGPASAEARASAALGPRNGHHGLHALSQARLDQTRR